MTPVARDGIGRGEGREPLRVLLHELEQAVAHVLGLVHEGADLVLD